MWEISSIMIVVFMMLFTLALCRTSSMADEQYEKMYKEAIKEVAEKNICLFR
ncbi:hypothetical protein ACJDU8_19535 [Clostridium sp. WILCCON 0269]|uniref:Uncharacterized protein n=1 Tax=Candidatus Clostridium eludens TaxID=3381663 RepID=A0ABW8SNV4_9CLOT